MSQAPVFRLINVHNSPPPPEEIDTEEEDAPLRMFIAPWKTKFNNFETSKSQPVKPRENQR